MRQSLNSRSKSVRSSSTAARFYYVRGVRGCGRDRLSISTNRNWLHRVNKSPWAPKLVIRWQTTQEDRAFNQEDRAFNIVDEQFVLRRI